MIADVSSEIADFLALAGQLPGVETSEHGRYSKLAVDGRTFAYLWSATRTVRLRQLIAEQLALVAERPEVFEVQFTSSGFGWVVVHLDGVARDELAELSFEAWRLTASAERVDLRGDALPS